VSITMNELLAAATVIPVLTVEDLDKAAPLALALSRGGLRVIEMTLRTPDALKALRLMKQAAPGLIIGMGTIRTSGQIADSLAAGAEFLVSPGLPQGLVMPLRNAGVPVLPGVATATEAMAAVDAGFEVLKFFPAEPAGGIPYLNALRGPLPDIRFCPTGSISREAAPRYLALRNVACVGGSWIVSPEALARSDWNTITENARAAAAM
jgi:2-dehydro-3-deoxyphosphogluconate aldolase/(4S)-4-hydroxy-2-oxoglutarate aldolase